MRVGILAVVSVLVLIGISSAQVDPFAPDPVYTPPPSFDCPYCGAVLGSQSALDAHIASEHTFVCGICGEVFHTSGALDAHMASEHPLPSGMEFVTIPSGSFMMGSPTSESNRDSDEDQHRVTVGTFELMTTEVTQGMWEEMMGENPAHDCGVGDNYPVYYVSWNDCQDFIDAMNDLDSNHTYRLPTEAEWEYACRAGTTTAYYWGGTMSGSYCWYMENSNGSTHPVGQMLPNAWGVYDMSGNVSEWCQDEYASDYEDCPTNGSAYTGSGSYRVIRGGRWVSDAQYCRSAWRIGDSPGRSDSSHGFRLARSAR